MRLAVDPREIRLGRDRDERRAIEEGIRDARHEVRGTRPQGREADAGVGREPAEDVGHEGRRFFMAGQDEPDGTVPEDVHQPQVLLARDAEREPDPFVLEAGDQEGRGVHRPRMGRPPI
jgi:hypothetical protein